jgi:hypothetical protein
MYGSTVVKPFVAAYSSGQFGEFPELTVTIAQLFGWHTKLIQ